MLARSSKAGFALVVVCLSAALLSGCGVLTRGVVSLSEKIENAELWHQGQHGSLSEKELEWAEIAWRYFENNDNPATGLVNSVDRYPSTTIWHTADYLAALIAAHELELVDDREIDRRFSRLLHTLNTMPLFIGELPNRVYSTTNAAMVDFANQPGPIGWSAIDIGRLLVWLKIASSRMPRFNEYIDRAVLRWSFCRVLNEDGQLLGGVRIQDKVETYPERGIGYLEYARLGYILWGFDIPSRRAFDPRNQVQIYDINIPYESNEMRRLGINGPVVTGPYILYGLEFNWDISDDRHSLDSVHTNNQIADTAEQLYLIQEQRYQRERILTARTDHQLGQAPYYLYDSIYAAGYPWNSISDSGESFPELALVSTRAAFGMWGLWRAPYTDRLMKAVENLHDPDRGWYEGRYETTGGYDRTITSSTNAIVLETLAYKRSGKLYRPNQNPEYAHIRLGNQFSHPGRCFPGRAPFEREN